MALALYAQQSQQLEMFVCLNVNELLRQHNKVQKERRSSIYDIFLSSAYSVAALSPAFKDRRHHDLSKATLRFPSLTF